MSDARERVRGALLDYLMWIERDENGYQPIDGDDVEGMADAVIAHLWSRADDPEVVEAALVAAEGANDLYPLYGETNSAWQARYFSASFAAFLEQLIGPRPEQEAE